MKLIRPVVALSLLAALNACDDYRSPTAPSRPSNLAPAFGIFDGAHGGGNTRFFFLPPMVSKPAINAEFHPGLRPRIDICEVENGVCKGGPTFKSFSAADVKVSTTDKQYHVNWDTKLPDVDPAKTYRIQVLLGDTPIGFADVDPVANGSQLKQVNTNEYIPLVDGRTLPIKFFLGKGVTCETNANNCAEHTVTSAVGGDFQAADERFWLQFPADVFPAGFEEVTITIERKPVPPGKACHTMHLEGIDFDEDTEPALAAEYEGCYRVTMDRNGEDFLDAGGFRRPVTVAMCLTGIPRTNQLLRIYKSDPQPRGLVALEDADPTVIAGFSQSCEGFEATPPTAPNSPLGALQSGVRQFASAVGRMLSPTPLYAIDLGLGGEIGIGGGFSDFGWGIEGSLETRGAQPRTVFAGSSEQFSVAVVGFTHHHHESDSDGEDPEEHTHAQPLAGVKVRFDVLLNGASIDSKTVSSVQANPEAEALAVADFDIGSGPSYVVRATLAHSGRSPVSVDVNVVEPTGSLTGTVSPASDSPLANVQLRLVGLSNPSFARSTSTGEGRSYGFENVPAGRYTLSAAAAGFNITRREVTVVGGQSTAVDFVLPPNDPGIDGVFSEGEWGDPFQTFDVNLPGGGTAPGELYIRNDAGNLYLAVRFRRSIVDPGNSAAFEFDSNRSGRLDDGDDGIILNPSSSSFHDLVRSDTRPNGEECRGCSFFDTAFEGGSEEGAAAFRNNGTFTVYEFSKPLLSEDARDFSRRAGDTIGLFVSIRMIRATEGPAQFPGDFGDTAYPGFGQFLQYTIR